MGHGAALMWLFESARKRRHRLYIRHSPVWQDKRYQVLQRCGWRCERCRWRRATQVHHLWYPKKLGTEPLSALQGLCSYCHEAVHGVRLLSRLSWGIGALMFGMWVLMMLRKM